MEIHNGGFCLRVKRNLYLLTIENVCIGIENVITLTIDTQIHSPPPQKGDKYIIIFITRNEQTTLEHNFSQFSKDFLCKSDKNVVVDFSLTPYIFCFLERYQNRHIYYCTIAMNQHNLYFQSSLA